MDGQTTTRDDNGRFAPGYSGNPAGKKKGTRNRATLFAAALGDGEGETMARVVIDKALAGDAVAARFCLTLLCPKPRGREITLEIPEAARPGDVVAAFNVTLDAMAAGEITPDEALVVTKVLDGRLRALKAWQLEDRLTAYDRLIPGDEVMYEAEESEKSENEGEDAEDNEDEASDGDVVSSPAETTARPCPAPSSPVIRSNDGIHSSSRAMPDPWTTSVQGTKRNYRQTRSGNWLSGAADAAGRTVAPDPSLPAFHLHLQQQRFAPPPADALRMSRAYQMCVLPSWP